MRYSAVVLDLDGTLLNADKRVTDRNRHAVQQCYEKGIKIIYATARPPRSVRQFLSEEMISTGTFVYYNGAQVVCNHTGTSFCESIPSDVSSSLIDYVRGHQPDLELSIEVNDEWFSLRALDYTIAMNTASNPVVKSIDELKALHATKILIASSSPIPMLLERFGQHVNIIVTDQGRLIQIMPLQASKETAIRKLCEVYGIEMSDVVAFGDDYNDLGLFGIAGYTVAMGNAVDALKAAADETTETNDQDGVAIVLERLFELERQRQ
ncbi:HAD family hydrolase [Cohnella ginsengisoli]|uniref:HAD family hydrolase n=1 Tax=Cohnella ginsengisoli TaxID=425004 RepID=A0A9X4QRT0_9BACL|nr:HAD family hydrolase [Cohnella ginsengisoli]